jgi:hypothetical protein
VQLPRFSIFQEAHVFDHDESHSFLSKGPIAGVAAGLLCLVLGGYALHEHHLSENLTAENGQLQASLNANRAQLDQLTATVNAMAAHDLQQPAPQPAALGARAVHVAKPSAVHRAVISRRRRAEDVRFKKMQSQLDAQGKEIEDTRNDLSNTRTELTGSIAKTHGELVLLEKKGERNYYEFDINKSKQFQHDGQVGIRLRKANTKHQYADLELMVDDRNLSQKHVNLYQPVMFYTPDSPQPVELVINNISKDHIHGYVSVSKYRQSELTAMANDQANATDASQASANADTQPPTRQKLTVPQQ